MALHIGSLIPLLREEGASDDVVTNAEDLENAHKFAVQHTDLLLDQSVMDYASLLVNAGLARLPYDNCWFEFTNWTNRENVVCVGVFAERRSIEGGGEVVLCHPFARLKNSEFLWDFYDVAGLWVVGDEAPPGTTNFRDPRCPRNAELATGADKEMGWYAALLVASAVAFLDLRETQKTQVVVSDRVAARRAADGKRPLFNHTVLTISQKAKEALRQDRRGLLERRAHWRRGHLRHLPSRVVPVAPTLVRGSGFVSKDYRI
jgi:hypothetical protein